MNMSTEIIFVLFHATQMSGKYIEIARTVYKKYNIELQDRIFNYDVLVESCEASEGRFTEKGTYDM